MQKVFAGEITSSKSICEGLALCNSSDPGTLGGQMISKGINVVLIIGAMIALFYLLWAGLNWIQSEGDKEKLATAKHKMTNALVGLIILFSVWTIWVTVVTALGIFKGENGGIKFEIPSLVK
jgi:hypothetical protein